MQESEIFSTASQLLENLKTDILVSKTREEHVRMTARANEAAALLEMLKFILNGDGESGETTGETEG